MPSTSSEIFAGRLTDPGATGLRARVDKRVWPSKPEQNPTLPYVVFWELGGGGGQTLGGRSGLQARDVRVEAVAETEAEAKAVLAEVRPLVLLSRAEWKALNVGVQGCFEAEDADEQTLEDGAEVAGQTFRLHFIPQ